MFIISLWMPRYLLCLCHVSNATDLHSECVNRCRGSTSLKWTDAVLQDQALLITSCIWTVFTVLVKTVRASSTSCALRGHYPAVWSHDPTALLHNPDNKQSAKYQTHTHFLCYSVSGRQTNRQQISSSSHSRNTAGVFRGEGDEKRSSCSDENRQELGVKKTEAHFNQTRIWRPDLVVQKHELQLKAPNLTELRACLTSWKQQEVGGKKLQVWHFNLKQHVVPAPSLVTGKEKGCGNVLEVRLMDCKCSGLVSAAVLLTAVLCLYLSGFYGWRLCSDQQTVGQHDDSSCGDWIHLSRARNHWMCKS